MWYTFRGEQAGIYCKEFYEEVYSDEQMNVYQFVVSIYVFFNVFVANLFNNCQIYQFLFDFYVYQFDRATL